MPKSYLTTEERSRILALREGGMLIKDIVAATGRSKSCILNLLRLARHLEPGELPLIRRRPGRRPVVGLKTWKLVKLDLLRNPFLTAFEVKERHPILLQNVSVRTIARHIRTTLAMPCRRAARKPLVTSKMRTKRLRFCRKYRHWTPEMWRKVLFSDESTFKVIQGRRGFVRRPPNSNRYEPRYTVPTVKHPDSVMIWSSFSGAGGKAGLFFLPKGQTMNAQIYHNVLQRYMVQYFELHNCSHFQYDSAPCHAARSIKTYLANKGIPTIDWPGNSPDLNPIENAWNQLKNKVCSVHNMSLAELKAAIQYHWDNNMTMEYFLQLADSMPARLAAVRKAGGYMTKY